MQTFNQALASAYFKKQITMEVALRTSSNEEELKEMIERGAGLVESVEVDRKKRQRYR
jgi:twitching motility protein PilT